MAGVQVALVTALGTLDPYDPNDSETFSQWFARFELFCTANFIGLEPVNAEGIILPGPNRRRSFFLSAIGKRAHTLLYSAALPHSPLDFSIPELVEVLRNRYENPGLIEVNRMNFQQRAQRADETVFEYVSTLQEMAVNCNFGEFYDQACKSQLICGLRYAETKGRLMARPDWSFNEAKTQAIQDDTIRAQMRAMAQANASTSHAVYSQFKKKGSVSNPQKNKSGESRQFSPCHRCGKLHDIQTCPAIGWRCGKCQKTGHIAKVCRSSTQASTGQTSQPSQQTTSNQGSSQGQKKKNKFSHRTHHLAAQVSSGGPSSDVIAEQLLEDSTTLSWGCVLILLGVFFGFFQLVETVSCKLQRLILSCIHSKETTHVVLSPRSSDPFLISVNIQSHDIQMEVDTGSGPVQVEGEVPIEVKIHDHKYTFQLIVCSGVGIPHPLLGRSWLDVISPGWRTSLIPQNVIRGVSFISHVHTPSIEELQLLFPRVFADNTDSCIEGFHASLVLKDNAKPVRHGPYSLAYGLVKPVEDILNQWESSGTAVRVRHATWASPGFPVPKKDGGYRFVVDFKTTLNPQLRTDYYPLPKPEDVFASLSKGTVYTSLDLKDAYTQLRLDNASQDLCVVNTHKGYYKLSRLIYGVSSAAAIFQNTMDDILRDIPNVVCYIDNILITGKDLQECVNLTLLVLGRLDKYNVRLKPSKCEWFTSQLEFLGFVVKEGCRGQAPSITSAISNFAIPKNPKEVQSFLGMLSFYAMFVPMLSTISKPLRRLTEAKVPFEWTSGCQESFDKCKSLLVSQDILLLYNPELPLVVYCDASPVGVGAVLCHTVKLSNKPVDKPVMFASCSLTQAQQNYAQIDREALAVIYAVTKFHKYLWGRQFTLITDNFAVRRIFCNTKSLPLRTGHRLPHWATILQGYNYTLLHKKCEFLCVADALSRLPCSTIIEDVFFIKVLNELPISSDLVAVETAKDPILSKVLQLCHVGWSSKNQYPSESPLHVYFKLRDSLTIVNKCLLVAARVVIPSSLRAQVLTLLHEGHPGIVRSKALARSVVWWPTINDDITSLCNNCTLCAIVNLPHKKYYIPWPKCSYPFQRVHMDYFEFKSSHYLIVCDAYSRYLHVTFVESLKADILIAELMKLFSIFGLPKVLVSDNGQPFDNHAYTDFATSFNIQILHSPAYHPESNGLAEKGVDIAKKGLSKVLSKFYSDPNFVLNSSTLPQLNVVLSKFLFNYRNTPTAVNLKSPNELLLCYKPNTLLNQLLPSRQSVPVSHFRVDETVLIKLHKRGPTLPGVIVAILGPNRYLVSIEGVQREVHHNQLTRAPIIVP